MGNISCSILVSGNTKLSFPTIAFLLVGYFQVTAQEVSFPSPSVSVCGTSLYLDIKANTTGSFSGFSWSYRQTPSNEWFIISTNSTDDDFQNAGTQVLTIFRNVHTYNNYQFRITGTDGNGNTSEAIVTLHVIAPSTEVESIQASKNNLCESESITLTAQGGIHSEGAIYLWYINLSSIPIPNQNDSEITVTPTFPSTTYQVQRKDVCDTTEKTQIKISVGGIPANITSITASKNSPCEGETITLTANYPGLPGGTVTWYESAIVPANKIGTGKTLNWQAKTTKILAQIENEECDKKGNSVEKEITANPRPLAGFEKFPTAACTGVAVDFKATPNSNTSVSYNWTFFGENPSTRTGPTHSVSFGTSGSKTVRLITSLNTCRDTATQDIMVTEKPTLMVNGRDPQFVINTPEKIPLEIVLTSNLPSNMVAYEYTCATVDGQLDGGDFNGTDPEFSRNFSLVSSDEEALVRCNVTVSVIDSDCIGDYSFDIKIASLLRVPNILSPNGDLYNQYWEIDLFPPPNRPEYSEDKFSIELYTRQGKCVKGCDSQAFTIDMAREWSAEDCPAGPLVYRILGPNGFQKVGVLTIIKGSSN